VVGQSQSLSPVRDVRLGSLALSYSLIKQLIGVGVRKASSTLNRQRMESIRRDPTELLARLRRAKSVLIVCHGNIIRSPFAAYALRFVLGPSTRVSVTSAGVDALPGREAHPHALRLASALHVDMSRHAASRLSDERIDKADVIFAADLLQLTEIRRRFPVARDKTFLLACLAPRTPLEVRDPIEGDEGVFAHCFIHILDAIHPIARTLMEPSTVR
jgi:protein-tyrosine-phosphatase